MSILERLIHRGYFDATEGRGDDLPGGGSDDNGSDTNDTVDGAGKGNDTVDGADGEDGKDEKEPSIPKSRFDQAVTKARREAAAALKRAEELEAQLAASKGTADAAKIEKEIDDLEEAYDAAVADNNAEKKKQIRAAIRQKQQQLSDSRASALAAQHAAIAIEQIRYDSVVELMEKEHPELNPDNDETYDEDRVAEVMELKEAYEASGHSSSQALRKAVGVLYKGQASQKKQAKDEEKDEEKEEGEGDEAKKAAEEAAKRKAEAVKKAMEAGKKQPPDSKKAGLDSDKGGKAGSPKDVTKMSQEDFEKLSPEDLKKLRGDAV